MLIHKAYRYRLYPNTAQELHLAVNFDQARFVYNFFLAEHKLHYAEHHDSPIKKGLTYYDNANALKALKRDPEYEWLKEAHSQVLQQSLKDLDRAHQNFFTRHTQFPRFHCKRGKIKAIIHRTCAGSTKNVTVTTTKSSRYAAARAGGNGSA